MTNINLIISDQLHKELKIQAAIEGRPVKQLIVELLQEHALEVQS